MMPSNEKVSKAMRVLDELRVSDGSTMSERDGWFEALRVLYDVAQLHLQSASELPKEREVIFPEDFKCGGCGECAGCKHYIENHEMDTNLLNNGFNSCLDQVTPILTRKNEEVALLKKENEELEQELEACRDANAQKKKRIAELEKLVEERSVNTGWAKAVEIEQEKVVLVNKIDELEDALKRADRITEEDIHKILVKEINTWSSSETIFDVEKKQAQAIHALITTRKGSERCQQ